MTILRSLLYTPAIHPKIDRAFEAGADAVIVDLEDSVGPAEKVIARTRAVEVQRRHERANVFVRVNGVSTALFHDDVLAVMEAPVAGLFVPKIESARDVHIADWLVGQMEVRQGRQPGSTPFRLSIETSKGLHNIDKITRACSRKIYLGLGVADFAVDLQIETSPDESQLQYAHSAVIVAARAADLEAPLDSVWLDMDVEGLKASTKRGMALGYQGKCCFHVSHVPVINEIYTPAEREVERAKRIVAAYEEAIARGQASFQLDGKLLDLPVILRATQLVERMQAITARAPR